MKSLLSILLVFLVACSINGNKPDVADDIATIKQAIETKDTKALYKIRQDMGMDPDRVRYIIKVSQDSTVQLHGALIAVLLPCEKAARAFIDEVKESPIDSNRVRELANSIEDTYVLMNYTRAFAVFKSTLNDYESMLSTEDRAQLYVRVNTPEILAEALSQEPDSALTEAIIKAYDETPELKKIFVSNLQK